MSSSGTTILIDGMSGAGGRRIAIISGPGGRSLWPASTPTLRAGGGCDHSANITSRRATS